MKYLFDKWEEIDSAIKKSSRTLLLSDYDGTLTPIMPTPAEAILGKEMKDAMIALTKNKKYVFGVISGRSLAELKKMVGIKGIYYAGNHGMEIEKDDFSFLHPAFSKYRPYIKELADEINAVTHAIKGVIFEDKGVTLSLHYRLVDKKWVPKLKTALKKICSPYEKKGKIRLTFGKKVFEIRPAINWHKGKAIEEIEKLNKDKTDLTFYLGDDKTDEDGFSALGDKGISVFVGKDNSSAKYYLKDTDEVGEFLKRINGLGS